MRKIELILFYFFDLKFKARKPVFYYYIPEANSKVHIIFTSSRTKQVSEPYTNPQAKFIWPVFFLNNRPENKVSSTKTGIIQDACCSQFHL